MEPSSPTPAHIPQSDIPVHLSGKVKDPVVGPFVREEPPGTFSVLKEGMPPYQVIEDVVKQVTGKKLTEGLINDIHGTFEKEGENDVVAETFNRDGREFIKFAVTWNVSVRTYEGPQVIKVKQSVYTGVEVPPSTSSNPDYDPVMALEEAKNKAYLLAKSYELVQRVGHSAVGRGEINQKVRDCANLILSPAANPSTLRQDEPFAAQHNFRQLKISLPDGGLVEAVLDLGERFYEKGGEDAPSLRPNSFLKEITNQFIVLRTSTKGVTDFDALEHSGITSVANPELRARYIKFLQDKNNAYLKEKKTLRAALDALVAQTSPLLARLQEATVSELLADYIKARKEYTSAKNAYTKSVSSAIGPLSRELILELSKAQEQRDRKAKELKQLTGLGALGMIEKRLLVLNARLEKNMDTLASLEAESGEKIEKTEELAKSLRTLIQNFKDREMGVVKLKSLMEQVETPEGNDALNSLLAFSAIESRVGTDSGSVVIQDSESAVTWDGEADSENITDLIDQLTTGATSTLNLSGEASTATSPKVVSEASSGVLSSAKSVYSSVASLFGFVRSVVQNLDLDAIGEASDMIHFGEIIEPEDKTPT